MSDYIVAGRDNNYSEGWYDEGYLDEEGNVEPYTSGYLAGVGKITSIIEGGLRKRVLDRVGSANGLVTIIEDHWDSGYCVTCSSENIDFEVQVDGEKVFRTNWWSGYGTDHDANLAEFVTGYAQFEDWLSGGDGEN